MATQATQEFRNVSYTPQIATGDTQQLQGTAAPDWIAALGGKNVINTGAGNDVILAGVTFGSIAPIELYGSEGILTNSLPNAGRNRIDAGSGNDYVVTGARSDLVNLGRGNDIYAGSAGGNDLVFAGAGADLIDVRGLGNRLIDAGGGDDRIFLGIGDATVLPGAGDDVIISDVDSYRNVRNPFRIAIGPGGGCIMAAVLAFGEVSIVGGTGPNFIAVGAWQNRPIPSELDPIDQPTEPPRINLDTATIATSAGNDTLITGNVRSVIDSGDGNDLIYAGAGDDRINAGKGNDIINLGTGEVVIPNALSMSFLGSQLRVGGGGNDRVDLGGGRDTVVLDQYRGFVRIYGFGRDDRLDVGDSLSIDFVRRGRDTVITNDGRAIAVVKNFQRLT